MSDLSRLWAGEHRVNRAIDGKFVLDVPAAEPVVVFTCRVDGNYCQTLRAMAEEQLGVPCEWRPV